MSLTSNPSIGRTQGEPSLPTNRYPAILCDPPWAFSTYSAKGKGRSPEAWYDCMPLSVIKAMPIATMAQPDCLLFLWTTDPHLEHGLDVIRAWGFTYKTVAFTWVKTRRACAGATRLDPDHDFPMGTGYWTRANPEMCLLASRGKPKALRHDVRQLIVAPRREHSRKPDEIYLHIEALCSGPYLELFARESVADRPLWTRWSGKAASPVRRWKSDSYPGAEAEPEAPTS